MCPAICTKTIGKAAYDPDPYRIDGIEQDTVK